jgi:hypothetical protein
VDQCALLRGLTQLRELTRRVDRDAVLPVLLAALTALPQLETLDLRGLSLTQPEMSALEQLPQLRKLSLDCDSARNPPHLPTVCAVAARLQRLQLHSRCALGQSALQQLLTALTAATAVTELSLKLWLADALPAEAACAWWTRLLSAVPQLEALELVKCDNGRAPLLTIALQTLPRLLRLILRECPHVEAATLELLTHATLQELQFPKCYSLPREAFAALLRVGRQRLPSLRVCG